MRAAVSLVSVVLLIFSLAGCQRAYYNTMERFGIHKRDILVDRVEDARNSQQEAQEQFSSALDQFRAMVDIDGGNLEKEYDRLNREYEKSEKAAQEIRDRIDSIEHVAGALFREWENELKQYSDDRLRRESQQRLGETQQRYKELIATMQRAEARMDPVLNTMRDQVLYLKHNLNARAIQALKGEVTTINRDVDRLLAAMNEAIAEADRFISDMRES